MTEPATACCKVVGARWRGLYESDSGVGQSLTKVVVMPVTVGRATLGAQPANS